MFGEFYKSDITGKVNDEKEQQIDTVEILKSIEEENGKRVAEITMDTLFKSGITYEFLKERGFTLPDGYHFTDEHGNIIEAAKILIKKNSPTYPKDYEECCKNVFGLIHGGMTVDVPMHYSPLIINFTKLIICRDAYWKIAGEQMGLGNPWEPDWTNEKQPKYGLYTKLKDTIINPATFAFPTEEMRDIFYDNFKELIDECKEIL